ncbi:Rap guanine nucleotide exchange factor 3 [Rhizoctonia solani]|uniref:Rap guanine nucleotide exchange factor 3 n=1 Tax=Rhizoctonia solani TaxID=456999 RepID=A0A0K6FZZ7_9AGAM|nr:Rap guanine nucleotide exchange factor 3 [Rhizoctonia solani]
MARKQTPTKPSKSRSTQSVRSGSSGETFDSTMTIKKADPYVSMYRPAPLPRAMSTMDLRTPTRDTFSIHSGSSNERKEESSQPHSKSRLSRRKSAPLNHTEPPSEPLPPVPRLVSNIDMPPPKVVPMGSADYVLGVIGSKGCGKSSLIRLALQGVDVEESRIVAASADGPTMTLACTTICRGAARIFEIDAGELLDLSEPGKGDRLWPDGFPKLNGVAVCYDAHDQESYDQAKHVLTGISTNFTDPVFITLLIACKSDSLDDSGSPGPELPPSRASKLGQRHGARFLQVTSRADIGLSQMVHAFQWMLDHLSNSRGTKRLIIVPRSKKSSGRTSEPALRTGSRTPDPRKTPEPPVEPTLPARARTKSAGDLVSTWISDSSDVRHEKQPIRHIIEKAGDPEKGSRKSIGEESVLAYGFPKVPSGVPAVVREEREREREIEVVQIPTPKPSEEVRQVPPLQLKIDGTPSEAPPRKLPAPLCMRWATTEQLIDKLFFSGVSEDEPWFIFNFFLTYRLFTTPRTVLLSFQKRLRELEESQTDPLLAGFVQQRLCELLQHWIEEYPNDFAAPGAPSALATVVRTACESTHLMYYGSEFTYFLDELPCLADDASSWAYVSADTPVEDESLYDFELDFDREFNFSPEADGFGLFDPSYTIAPHSAVQPVDNEEEPPTTARTARFESAGEESIGRGISPDARRGGQNPAFKALQAVANELLDYDASAIAEEITRLETDLFLKIKPRDWVRRGVKEDKLGKPKSIVEMNAFFDRIGKWVMSVVVSLNRAQDRARLVTHLCEVAQALRLLNNYSSLRAFHVGINCVCETGDVVQSQVPDKVWRKYQSADKLLRVNENHLLYRLAVKNTFGAGIPSLEVHSSDLSRIGEMQNINSEGHVHWAKFTHLGNNIHEIHGFQERIREDGDYAFEPKPELTKLILETELLDMDTIYNRCSQVDRDLQHGYPVPIPTSTASRIKEYLRR